MSHNEYIEWQEYYHDEPFLADRLEMQLAKIGYSNMATAFGKIDLEFDYFLVSHYENKHSADSQKGLENKIKAVFGVK